MQVRVCHNCSAARTVTYEGIVGDHGRVLQLKVHRHGALSHQALQSVLDTCRYQPTRVQSSTGWRNCMR